MDYDPNEPRSSYGPRGQEPGQPVYPYRPHKTNGKAIAGMVLGILSVILPYIGLIIGIVGIFISAFALREIRRNGEQGRGMAIAGLVCSIVGTVIYGLLVAFVIIALVFFSDSMHVEYYNDFNNFS